VKHSPEIVKPPLADESASSIYLIDTSALLSFIEDEEGADYVEQALKQKETIVPWPVLLEMYYITLQEKGQLEADRRFALVKQLKVNIRLLTRSLRRWQSGRAQFSCIKTRNLTP
jgi:uncharacterized protein with PIN domain